MAAQVFTCNYSGSIKNKLLKGGDKLFLKIDGDRISGKAFICNEEGRNGYIDNFDYPLTDVREVLKGEYMGNQALIMNTRITSLYGTKKAQTIFPSIKDIDIVIEKLGQLKESSGGSNAAAPVKQATTQSQPIQRPTGTPVVKPVQAPEPQPVKKPEAPAPKPAPVKAEAPAPAPAKAPKAEAPAEEVGSSLLKRAEAVPTSAPAPAVSPITSTPVLSRRTAPTPPPAPAPAPAKKEEDNSEDFQKRLEKLYILKDCGMLSEKEFDAKKLELVSELCGMSDFNTKVEKLVVLKDMGMLDDSEFNARKADIIKECCNTDVKDLNEYKSNIEKLPYLKIGGMINDSEFEEKKKSILDEVEFDYNDTNTVLLHKLERWPILKEVGMLSDDEFKLKIQSLVDIIDVGFEDPIPTLKDKLNKWPVLVDAKVITENDFRAKQQQVINDFVNNAPWSNVDEFKVVVERLIALKECNWLSDSDFHAKKVDLLRKVSAIDDYVTKVEIYIASPKMGLISEEDYNLKKEEFIADIFKPHESTEEFQVSVKKLMDLEKVGMLTSDEFTNYKMKLMSEL